MQQKCEKMRYRKLIRPVSFQGKGLHSGADCRLSIEPSDDGFSLKIGGNKGIEEMGLPLSRLAFSGSGRGSDLIFPDGRSVRTCEHILSALAGLGVWQARLVVNGPEMPALDGCAAQAAAAIMENSIPTALEPPLFSLQCPLHIGNHERFVVALPSPSFHVTYVIDYEAEPIGTQILDYEGTPEDYLKKIAPARTFAMAEDIEVLRAQGLALGGSLDNAILVEKKQVQTTGGLRFPDEFVRHKMLDLIGDLAVLGRPVKAHVVAVRAGHVQHLQLVERLRALVREV